MPVLSTLMAHLTVGMLSSLVFAQDALAQNMNDWGLIMETAHFWVFVLVAPISVISALAVINLRNPIHAALMLVVNFFTIAFFYIMLNAQFLGVIQITVYGGAVVILFLFVLMLIGVAARTSADESPLRDTVAGGFASLAVLAVLLGSVWNCWMSPQGACSAAGPGPGQSYTSNYINSGTALHSLSTHLFTDYFWPFEITSVLLMVAAIGAMVIGRHSDKLAELVEVGYGVPPGHPLPDSSYYERGGLFGNDDDYDDEFDEANEYEDDADETSDDTDAADKTVAATDDEAASTDPSDEPQPKEEA